MCKKGHVPWNKGKKVPVTKAQREWYDSRIGISVSDKTIEKLRLNAGREKGCTPWNKGLHGIIFRSIESRLKQSISSKGKSNPHTVEHGKHISLALKGKPPSEKQILAHLALKGRKTPEEVKLKISKTSKLMWNKKSDEEKRKQIERWCNRGKYIVSRGQKKLFDCIKSLYPDSELNKKVYTKKSFRFIDIAIPSFMLGIEYDGDYWHRNSGEKDRLRDLELAEVGWKIIRFSEAEANKCIM